MPSLNSLSNNTIYKCVNNLQNNFKQYWHDVIFDDSRSEFGNKLRNYRIYKNQFTKERYLDVLYHLPYRKAFSKLRLSCHNLNIEVGRRVHKLDRLQPHQRICTLCNLNACEDEAHFIIECPFYREQRSILISNMQSKYPFIKHYSSKLLFNWLVGNYDEYVILHLAKFLHSSFELRRLEMLK